MQKGMVLLIRPKTERTEVKKVMNIQKLKAALVEKGFTQRSLSKEMNVSKNTLNAKINGKTPISIQEATKLAEVLNLSKEEFDTIFFL